jgi:hypothetical protein
MGFVSDIFGGQTKDVKPVVNADPDKIMFRQQQAFADTLKQQAAGQGPSVASTMLQQQNQQNAANMNAQAAGMRGVNAGLAMRQAMQANAAGNQQTAAQSVLARMQEQQNAQGLLGNQLNTMQSQIMQGKLGANQLNTQIAMGNSNNSQAAAGGLINAGASAGALLSDERQKTNIHDGGRAAYEFLEAIQPHKYQYKNPGTPGAAGGEQLGVMAQELEQSPAGRQMVMETPQGKMIDPARATSAMLAAQAEMHERLKQLEGRPKGYADGGFVSFNPFPYGVMSAPQAAQPMVLFTPPNKKPKEEPKHTDVTAYTGPNQAGAAMVDPAIMFASHGGRVPGKSRVSGDSAANDTVPAMLSPGELVIPRSHAQSPQMAKAFIDHVMGKKRSK